MIEITIELDLLSAVVADVKKIGNDELVLFLAEEVKQTSFCAEGETNPPAAK